MKENNLRIKADDTSGTGSFPSNDWELTFNDSSNGGENRFSVTDMTGSRIPFTVEAGAPNHTLYVAADGFIGMQTNSPVVQMHAVDGNTPALRLEQDGSNGFATRIWDIAGNETNFFVRDVSNASALPFRIMAGAPGNALYLAPSGNVGLGTDNPSQKLHVEGGNIFAVRDGPVNFTLSDTADTGPDFRTQLANGSVRFSYVGSGAVEMELLDTGDLRISGNYFANATQLNVPDYVFADDYDLRSLSEVRAFIEANSHLPEVPSAAMIAENGLDMTEMQMTLLKKIEELTLYMLAQEDELASVRDELDALRRN